MSNLFNSLGNSQNNKNPMQMVQQLKSNPSEFLKSRGFNIPNGVDTSNPQSIINGLMRSGQIGNGKYQQVMHMMQKMSGR